MSEPRDAIDEASAWKLLLQHAQAARAGRSFDDGGRLADARGGSAVVGQLIDLYLPLCVKTREWVLAHLGQSLDGRIATRSGASQFITGSENQIHSHRLR